jgi:ATPase subunit of ABC transporter with duplicated ATPase domains
MKTTKAVRLSDNFVGVEINTIQDVVKAQAAGLKLVDKEGWEYSIYTIDDEETGEEREPTEQEIFEHITEDLSKGKEVYACMELSSDWEVQERAKTHLTTNFYVGQQVFLMRDNKIAEKTISRIIIEKNEEKEVCKLLLNYDSKYTNGVDVFATKEELVESLMKE